MSWLNGVRGRIVLVVIAVTACLYSLLGTVGFIQIATSGRTAIRERVNVVLDQYEAGLRAGTNAVSLTTADGVEAQVADNATLSATVAPDVLQVRRTIELDNRTVVLLGSASKARLTESMHSLYRTMWVGIPLAVVLTAIVAALAVRRTLSPVSEITRFAASVTRHDASARVPVPDTDDEIEELAVTVNAMLGRIEEGQRQQRQFTSDAAHELRTPLMALQGEIELAQRLHEPVDDAFLARLESLTKRLSSRVADLVLLSSLDEHPPIHRERLSVSALVEDEAVIVRAHMNCVHDADVFAMVDQRLVVRAVSNLLANATRHARSRVEASVVDQGDDVVVHVDDDGPGVSAEEAEKIFQRFGRLEEARSVDSGGSGLGLAIVASVAQAHDGAVTVTASPLGGARFTLRLPKGSEREP